MIVIVDHRPEVCEAFGSGFEREGYSVVSFSDNDLLGWILSTSEVDLAAVEAVLVGEGDGREHLARQLCKVCNAPIIALCETASLDCILRLFMSGVDDVLKKPIHVREIIARIGAIRRRNSECKSTLWSLDGLNIYGGGRDIEIGGQIIQVPRRELRILEYLAQNRNRRVTRSQIFNAVYGMLDEEVEESVVESHISKLRKKLRLYLGYDPIDTQRFLGYQLTGRAAAIAA